MLGSLIGVLLFYTQPLVTGMFLLVVVAAQTILTRQRTY
jgi:hypothetical protein